MMNFRRNGKHRNFLGESRQQEWERRVKALETSIQELGQLLNRHEGYFSVLKYHACADKRCSLFAEWGMHWRGESCPSRVPPPESDPHGAGETGFPHSFGQPETYTL